MSVELKKTNPACINIELIDLESCIGDSLPIINNNTNKLKESVIKIFEDIRYQIEVVTFFSGISSKLLESALNIQAINDTYNKTYTTVQNLSSKWNSKEFTVYYPTMLDISTWYDQVFFQKSSILIWLAENFPTEKFPKNQVINIYVSLYYINYFDFVFRGSYLENCAPIAHSNNTLNCSGCGKDNRNAGCNIDGRACTNAYSYCRSSLITDSAVYNCNGYVGTTYDYDSSFTPAIFNVGPSGYLSINYSIPDIQDKFLSRIIKLKVRNIENQWTYE
jgi:hypothetical protein